jgi:hypothetical protein
MTTTGKTLVSEDFSGAVIPSNWLPRGESNSFSIVDGALQGVCKPGGSHDPFVVVRLDAHDVTVRFSAKFVDPGVLLVMIDGHSDAFAGNTHLVRLTLKPKEVSLQQELGTPESKQAQKQQNAKVRGEGKKPAAPTTAQLADPKFYRTEQLGAQRTDLIAGQWHEVLLEINGGQLIAQIDNQVVLIADASVADAAKSRMALEVGKGTVQIDNVLVSENIRRSDWEQVKRKIVPTTAPAK